MTTAGTVASQVAVPKTTVGGARDAGAKGDAAAGGDDGEFADVLTKLQGEDAPRTDALTDEQQQDMEQHAADGGAGRSTIDAMLGSLAGGDQQQNPTPAATPAANPVNDIIAAAVAFAPIQPASTRQSEGGAPTQTQTETQTQAQEPQPASKLALLDETVASGAPNQPDAMVDNAPGEFTAAETMAVATDPALARAVGAAGPDKGKPERKSSDPPDVARASATVAAAVQPRVDKVEGAPPPTANVVRQEVHFAPVASAQAQTGTAGGERGQGAIAPEALDGDTASASSIDSLLPSAEDLQSSAARPAQQIADRILSEAGTAPEFADRAGMTTGQPGMKPALKVLHIQLQPADMGTVTVRMELKDADLSLQVEADRAETVSLIRNDQDTLSSLLRSAGYNVDSGSVRVVEIDRTAPSQQQSGQNGAQSSFQSPSQSQSGASERQEHQQRGGTGTNGAEAAPQMTRNDAYETNTNRAGRGLYL